MKSYELVYSCEGHSGPYWGLDNARQWACKLLIGGRIDRIYIVPRSAIHYSAEYAVETITKEQALKMSIQGSHI